MSISGIGSGGFAPPPMNAKKVIGQLDQDGDGKLSQAEFKKSKDAPPLPNGMSDGDLFKKIDSNQDGSIDGTELQSDMDKMRAKMSAIMGPREEGSEDGASLSLLDYLKKASGEREARKKKDGGYADNFQRNLAKAYSQV